MNNRIKTAGLLDAFQLSDNAIVDYYKSKVNEDNKAASVLAMLTPGLIFTFFFGRFKFLAVLASFAAAYFKMDIEKLITPIFNSVKSDITSGKVITTGHIDQYVDSAFSSSSAPQTPAEPEDEFSLGADSELRNIRRLKLALIVYANDNSEFQFSKYAKPSVPTQTATTSMLKLIIGWIFKVILSSAGFLVAADMAKKLMGKPSDLDKNPKNKPEVVDTRPLVVSTQTKFAKNTGYDDSVPREIEKIIASQSSIENTLINYAKEVYSGLDNLDNIIRSSRNFNLTVEEILDKNKSNLGYIGINMPSFMNSKKQIVDVFIDEVARNSP